MKKHHGRLYRPMQLLLILFLIGLLAYSAVIAMICWKKDHIPPVEDYQAIVVLGAQVLPTGEPSIQLAWRLDKALEIWQEDPVLVVTCGAQGGDEPAPEALVMRDYLTARGVDEVMILTDPDSFNTRQNLRHAAELLEPYGVEKVLIVTSDYHLPRAMALAEDQGLEATGVGSPTKEGLRYWAKNHLREGLAWIKYWAVKYLHLPLE